ncbi:MAG: hypothetical protein ACSHXH_02410 [Marivita sp.]|uniref:hypothetical protein n=1 Tax=Marivita sp. TaxID=2003365 RepID=UPI003EFAC960
MKKTVMTAVFATLTGTMVFAQSATDQIVNDLKGQGFDRIEIDNGIDQIKAEAIRGTQKLEVVYDRVTGNILKQEVERVDSDDDTRPGIEIRNRDRNFVDVARGSDNSGLGTGVVSTNLPDGYTDTDQLVSDLQAQGFTRIEVKNGLTQTKVEAVRGTEKVETVFDRATGAVIEQEIERVDSDDDTAPGVSIRDRNRDFADAGRSDDDDDDDDDRRGGRDDDDDDDDHRGGRDDDDDDDRDDDRDDDDDDDDNDSDDNDDDDDDNDDD